MDVLSLLGIFLEGRKGLGKKFGKSSSRAKRGPGYTR